MSVRESVQDGLPSQPMIIESRAATAAARAMSADDRTQRLVYLVTGLGVIGVVLYILQYSTQSICCGDFDGYYHFKWARMLWEGMVSGDFPPKFNSLPLTTLDANDYVDHHFLFHVLQIPFTWFGTQETGAKISAWLFGTLGIFSCYWLVVRYRLSYTPVWLIALLACSNAFLYRINMTKAMSVSLVLICVGIYLLFERKYKWLPLLAFVFALTYDMWVLLLGLAGLWSLIRFWSDRPQSLREVEWKPIVYVGVGALLGFIINPYFPDNMRLFYEHVVMKASTNGFPVPTGMEWYPWDTREFMAACTLACIAMVVGYISFDPSDKKRAERPLFFLVLSTVLMLATAYWKRFNEYWPPFAVLFAAFTLQMRFDPERASLAARLPDDVMDELQPFLDRDDAVAHVTQKRDRWEEFEVAVVGVALASVAYSVAVGFKLAGKLNFAVAFVLLAIGLFVYAYVRGRRQLGAVAVACVLGLFLFANVRQTSHDIADMSARDRFRGGMEWITANVPKGELIFNTNWDSFPKLFFYSSDYGYVSGLDPNYLFDRHPDLAKAYDRIRMGEEKNPAPIIRGDFGARYIFTDQKKRGEDLYYNLADSGWVDEVYDDDFCTVLKIRDERGTPAPDFMKDDDGGGDADDSNSADDNDGAEDENAQP